MLQRDVAPAAAQARRSRCRSPRRSSRSPRTLLTDLIWTRGVPARRAAVADRPGAVLQRRHQPARAAARPPLAQPRVRAQRRPRAAAGARARRRRSSPARRLRRGGASCSRTSALGLAFGIAIGLLASLLLPRGACRDEGDPGAPARALRARRRVRHLRRHGRCRRTATASSPCSSARSCSASAGPTSAATFERARRGHRRDRQARDLRRVRLAADVRRPVRRRLGGGGDRRRHAAASRGRSRSGSRSPARGSTRPTQGVHGLVRPQGRGDDDVLAARAGPAHRARAATDLQHRRARRLLLDHRPRADRHPGSEWIARRAGRSSGGT